MSHYYTNDENLKVNIKDIEYTYGGHLLKFSTDSGVFSKNRVDFGTNVLLNSLPDLEGKRIIDVGCGVGVIGLCVAKRYKSSFVTLVDVNKRAIDLTMLNAIRNKVNNVHTILSDVYSNVDSKFDVIITNPPIRAGKKKVHQIFSDGFNVLNKNGKVFAVVQKKQGALSLKEHMKNIYGNCEEITKQSGYYVLTSIKETD